MTIEQTVEIPASRRITLDLPLELPMGKAKVELTVTPEKVLSVNNESKIRLTNELKMKLLNGETLRSLTGILHTEMSLEEIREERLAKYLQ